MPLTFLRSPPPSYVTLLGVWMSSLVPLGPKLNPEGHTFPLPSMLKRGLRPLPSPAKSKTLLGGVASQLTWRQDAACVSASLDSLPHAFAG